MTSKSLCFLAALGAASALAFGAHAAPAGVKTGVLTCNVSSGWGLVFGSSRDLSCTFSSIDNTSEHYTGKVTSYGVDIGYHSGGVMAWAVFAPSRLAPGALAGNYGGVSGGAAAGVGGSANVLVGGSDKTVSLQPLSIEGEAGLNLAAGVTGINLAPSQ